MPRQAADSTRPTGEEMTEAPTTEQQTPYEILGDQGIKDLAKAFFEAMDELPLAAEIRAMHSENLDHVTRMMSAYLTGWMGGPPVYQAIKGTVCLTDPHEPFRMLKEPMKHVAETVRNCEDSTPRNSGPNIIAVS